MKKITLLFLSLSTLFLNAQNVVFTIENATASGATVTDIVEQDGNTYALTATNTSGANALIITTNATGVRQFYSEFSGAATASWQISITENGTPLNFTFGSVDYLGLAVGTYNITNDSGDIITNNFDLFRGGFRGTISAENIDNASDIDGFNINGITSDALAETAFLNIEINPVTLSNNSDEINEVKQVSVFPNPSSTEINISTDSSLMKNIIIYDLKGNFVKEVNTTKKVNVSDLAPGLYLLKVSENNKSAIIKLLVN